MKTSPASGVKILETLMAMSSDEMMSFAEFAVSKYFTGERSHSRLLKILKSYHAGKFKVTSDVSLIEKLSAELQMSRKSLRSRLSELHAILEKYLINEFVFNAPGMPDMLLSKAYYERGKWNYSLHSAKRNVLKLSDSYLDRDILGKYAESKRMVKLASFQSGRYSDYQESRSAVSVLRLSAYLIGLFADSLEFHQQLHAGMERAKFNPDDILDSMETKALLSLIKSYNSDVYGFTMIFYSLHNAFRDLSDTESFLQAVNFKNSLSHKLGKEETENLNFLMITFCINQITEGRSEYYRIVFSIIKDKLESGFDSELRLMNYPINNFRDYVLIGLKVKEYEWVRKFVEHYSSLIPEKYRDVDAVVATSHLLQSEGRFEEALKKISTVRKRIYLHYIDAAHIKLRAFYELGRSSDFHEELHRFNLYIRNHTEIPHNMRKRLNQQIKDLRLLQRFSEGKISQKDLGFKLRNRDLAGDNSWVTDKLLDIVN